MVSVSMSLRIYNDLEKKVQANKWEIGELLPSENELSVIYKTSRETIRKALNLLSQNGFVQKSKEKGRSSLTRTSFPFQCPGFKVFPN